MYFYDILTYHLTQMFSTSSAEVIVTQIQLFDSVVALKTDIRRVFFAHSDKLEDLCLNSPLKRLRTIWRHLQ